ncbi:MAG: DUF1553 domain-containing protein [Bacteroidota bacterium]
MKSPHRLLGYCLLFGLLNVFFPACGPALPAEVALEYQKLDEELDFNLHVKPILSDKCFACHGPDQAKQAAGLRLDLDSTAFAELAESPGQFAIKAGDLAQSQVFHRIISDDPEQIMPPPEFKVELSNYEKAVLIKWIEDGAKYKAHWAFIPPSEPSVPRSGNNNKTENPIDQFVLAKLSELGLSPAPPAAKAQLLRRLSLDLTGLPPTQAETQAFLADNSENAYLKQVDRLLASEHYGEKMATDWMDLARYSDTYGYQVDRYRDMSPWRDWVIKAFNENMPYDQFVTWQLAGDLLPNASREQILATGFNRLHPQNMEGGIVDEEFRVEYVSDRVSVLGDGLLGLTLSCAKCHDHKYDPISQKDYYQVYSFFNNVNETGQISWDKGTPVPTLMLPTNGQEAKLDSLKRVVKQAETSLKEISEQEKKQIEQWIEQKTYRKLSSSAPQKSQKAFYRLENTPITNAINPRQKAKMDREFSAREIPHFIKGYQGRGLQLDGDAWLDLKGVGIFKRNDPFTISLWINLPDTLQEGVIFHKNKGTRLHSYRGYHLYLKDNKLEWMMAHTWPENAIILRSHEEVPKNQWINLSLTYDGSSQAAGCKLYLNGEEMALQIEKDNLYKDIIFHNLRDVIYASPIEPNLQIGARWRGLGIKGAKVDNIRVYDRSLSFIEVQQLAGTDFIRTLIQKGLAQLNAFDKEALRQYYLANLSLDYQEAQKRLKDLRRVYVDSVEKVKEVMVMQEMPEPRQTFILNRGVYDDYGEAVNPNTLSSLPAMPADLPKNRLGLAEWLFLPQHPLTARVAVNRYWQQYFGQGLVKTTQDFGNQGELPSHPELLDWLAIQFEASNWDVKALQRLIVTSATYRQSSFADAELLALDKENKWLARGPKMRLSSEMMRDNALSASGLLNQKLGGESVRPYQPDGLWLMNGGKYVPDDGQKLYRRSFYTIWKRTVPNPTLATFDQPERNICTVKRQKTNTPLQALVLLNDPTYVEVAKVMGEQMARQPNPQNSIVNAYERLTGKSPNDRELAILLSLQKLEYENFKVHPPKTKGWLETGQYQVDDTLDPALIASYAVVASTILNSDAAITKR